MFGERIRWMHGYLGSRIHPVESWKCRMCVVVISWAYHGFVSLDTLWESYVKNYVFQLIELLLALRNFI